MEIPQMAYQLFARLNQPKSIQFDRRQRVFRWKPVWYGYKYWKYACEEMLGKLLSKWWMRNTYEIGTDLFSYACIYVCMHIVNICMLMHTCIHANHSLPERPPLHLCWWWLQCHHDAYATEHFDESVNLDNLINLHFDLNIEYVYNIKKLSSLCILQFLGPYGLAHLTQTLNNFSVQNFIYFEFCIC